MHRSRIKERWDVSPHLRQLSDGAKQITNSVFNLWMVRIRIYWISIMSTTFLRLFFNFHLRAPLETHLRRDHG